MPKTSDGQAINQDNANSRYKAGGYVRVSTVVNILDKGPGLVHWYYKFKNYKEMQEAFRLTAVRGSTVDGCVKEVCNGADLSTLTIDQAYAPYIEALLKWRKEWKFDMITSDEEVYDDDLKYVGTLDLYGTLARGEGKMSSNVIIDVKTGEPGRNTDGTAKYAVYESNHYQTAAYRAAKHKAGSQVDGNWILKLFSDGNYLFVPDPDYEKSFTIFSHLLSICQLKNGNTKKDSDSAVVRVSEIGPGSQGAVDVVQNDRPRRRRVQVVGAQV